MKIPWSSRQQTLPWSHRGSFPAQRWEASTRPGKGFPSLFHSFTYSFTHSANDYPVPSSCQTLGLGAAGTTACKFYCNLHSEISYYRVIHACKQTRVITRKSWSPLRKWRVGWEGSGDKRPNPMPLTWRSTNNCFIKQILIEHLP